MVKLGYHLISTASVGHDMQLVGLKHCRATKEGPNYQKIVLKVWNSKINFLAIFHLWTYWTSNFQDFYKLSKWKVFPQNLGQWSGVRLGYTPSSFEIITKASQSDFHHLGWFCMVCSNFLSFYIKRHPGIQVRITKTSQKINRWISDQRSIRNWFLGSFCDLITFDSSFWHFFK